MVMTHGLIAVRRKKHCIKMLCEISILHGFYFKFAAKEHAPLLRLPLLGC